MSSEESIKRKEEIKKQIKEAYIRLRYVDDCIKQRICIGCLNCNRFYTEKTGVETNDRYECSIKTLFLNPCLPTEYTREDLMELRKEIKVKNKNPVRIISRVREKRREKGEKQK